MNLSSLRCPLCIDGYAPAGVNPLLGPVVVDCPLCRTRCRNCNGASVFPITGGYALELLIDVLDRLGVVIDICDGCFGSLTPALTDTTTEVQP